MTAKEYSVFIASSYKANKTRITVMKQNATVNNTIAYALERNA
jgi:hypothetical protein